MLFLPTTIGSFRPLDAYTISRPRSEIHWDGDAFGTRIGKKEYSHLLSITSELWDLCTNGYILMTRHFLEDLNTPADDRLAIIMTLEDKGLTRWWRKRIYGEMGAVDRVISMHINFHTFSPGSTISSQDILTKKMGYRGEFSVFF